MPSLSVVLFPTGPLGSMTRYIQALQTPFSVLSEVSESICVHFPPPPHEGVTSCFWIDSLVLSIPETQSHQPKVVSQMMGGLPCLQGGPSLWGLSCGWFWWWAIFTDYSFRSRWILPTWHKPVQGIRNPELHDLGDKTRVREPHDPRSFSMA